MIVAYLVWGRMIRRGSSIRLTLLNAVVTLSSTIGYIAAADVWLLIPVAIVGGIVNAGGEITFLRTSCRWRPRDKIGEYATAQSLLMGIRGTAAPFVAAALLGIADARVVLLIGVNLMTAGARSWRRRAPHRADRDAGRRNWSSRAPPTKPGRNALRPHRVREAVRDHLVALVRRWKPSAGHGSVRREPRSGEESNTFTRPGYFAAIV